MENEKEVLLSDVKCSDCKYCYRCKDDDGSWLICDNKKANKYIEEIDRNFGCIFFEKRDE